MAECECGFFSFAAMGNEKSNSYWEAELPPNYDRVGIENFIRAKYAPFTFIVAYKKYS